MGGQTELVKLAGRWGISNVTSVKKIHYAGQVFLVSTADGLRYILKQKNNPDMIKPEYLLLSGLGKLGAPVAVLLTGKKGEYSFRRDSRYYCLYPFLPGGVNQNYFSDGAEKRAYTYGRAIAMMHAAMKQCDEIEGFNSMNLPEEITNEALPVIIRHSGKADAVLTGIVVEELKTGLVQVHNGLPVQLIHKDMHPNNLLFDKRNKLTGIIDFDSAVRGVRIFDPCYCCAYILISGYKDSYARAKWFKLLNKLVNGYESINPLTVAERSVFCHIILAALFVLDAVFFSVNNTGLARKTQQVIFWVYENMYSIKRVM